MTVPIRTCRRCGHAYRGRCKHCHPARASSRPATRRQSALILSRLVRIEPGMPQPVDPEFPSNFVTTATFVSRHLERSGIPSYADLPDDEYLHLIRRSSRLADRWQRMFGANPPADRASVRQ